MALELLNIGLAPNDGTGDTLRVGAAKLNSAIDALNSQFFNVRAFGAKGDGATNDTAALQAAADAADSIGGGLVFVPAGIFIGNIALGSNTVLGGLGTIKNPPGAGQNQHVVTNKDHVAGNTRIVVRDITVDANRAQSTLTYSGRDDGFNAVHLVKCSYSTCRGVKATGALKTGTFPNVSNWGDGIAFIDGTHNTVVECDCWDNVYDGIKFRGERGFTCSGNRSWDNGRSGIQISRSPGLDDTVKANGTLRGVVIGNHVSHSSGVSSSPAPQTSAIYLHTASYIIIQGNVTHLCEDGVGTSGTCEHNLITGNTFHVRGSSHDGSGGVVFRSDLARFNTVVGNYFFGSIGANRAILKDRGVSNVFRGNTFRRDGGTGVWTLSFTGSSAKFRGNDVESSFSVSIAGTGNDVVVDDTDSPTQPGITSGATDFDGGAVAGLPDGWTARWDQTDATWNQDAGGFLRLVKTSATRTAASWDDAGVVTDVEVLAKIRTSSDAASTTSTRVLVRGSGSAGDETGLAVGFGSTGSRITVTTYASGTPTTTEEDVSYNADTWYWLRVRVIGSNVTVTFWEDGSTEGSPVYSGTPGGLPSSGFVGVFGFSSAVMDWDYFSYATGGGTAQ